jgi:hypothetical protein
VPRHGVLRFLVRCVYFAIGYYRTHEDACHEAGLG